MNAEDQSIYNALVAEDEEIFSHFFEDDVDLDFTSPARETLQQMFQKYTKDDFDAFILRVHGAIQSVPKDKECQTAWLEARINENYE